MGASAMRFKHCERGKGELRLGFHWHSAIDDGLVCRLNVLKKRLKSTFPSPQAPMSRVELDTFINDRYAAIEDRLQVCVSSQEPGALLLEPYLQRADMPV